MLQKVGTKISQVSSTVDIASQKRDHYFPSRQKERNLRPLLSAFSLWFTFKQLPFQFSMCM